MGSFWDCMAVFFRLSLPGKIPATSFFNTLSTVVRESTESKRKGTPLSCIAEKAFPLTPKTLSRALPFPQQPFPATCLLQRLIIPLQSDPACRPLL